MRQSKKGLDKQKQALWALSWLSLTLERAANTNQNGEYAPNWDEFTGDGVEYIYDIYMASKAFVKAFKRDHRPPEAHMNDDDYQAWMDLEEDDEDECPF